MFVCGGFVVELSEAKKQVEAMQQEVARFGRSL
jgi:hypothetical protein